MGTVHYSDIVSAQTNGVVLKVSKDSTSWQGNRAHALHFLSGVSICRDNEIYVRHWLEQNLIRVKVEIFNK